jgi:hypothetical protein
LLMHTHAPAHCLRVPLLQSSCLLLICCHAADARTLRRSRACCADRPSCPPTPLDWQPAPGIFKNHQMSHLVSPNCHGRAARDDLRPAGRAVQGAAQARVADGERHCIDTLFALQLARDWSGGCVSVGEPILEEERWCQSRWCRAGCKIKIQMTTNAMRRQLERVGAAIVGGRWGGTGAAQRERRIDGLDRPQVEPPVLPAAQKTLVTRSFTHSLFSRMPKS